MKKIFSAALFVFGALSSFGAYQHDNFLQLNNGRLTVAQDAGLVLNFSSGGWQDSITNWEALTVVSTKPDGSTVTNTVDITGNSVAVGNVSKGDSLEFWLSKNGNDFYQFDHVWGSGWDNGMHDYLHFGANWGEWGSRYSEFQFQVSGSAPSGQPLPGVLATLLIGGASGGMMAWRRKRVRK
ncbi:MAG: hypothetical protein HPZ91_02110 [Lentisphaeria bacterium]|nr:hypothetical protein [Lentisphaeria bacterium]